MSAPIGLSVKRREDRRFLTGRGRYLDDLRLPDLLHAAIVRSPHAHARILAVDAQRAMAQPGVVAVLTIADLPECAAAVPPLVPSPRLRPYAQPALAGPKARYAGEAVAVAVADDAYRAADAAQAVDVRYDVLPAAATVDAALAARAPRVFDEWPDNAAGPSDGAVGDTLEREHHGRELPLVHRRRLGRDTRVPGDDRVAARVHDGPRPNLFRPTPADDADGVDRARRRVDRRARRMQHRRERALRPDELVERRREPERDVRQNDRATTPHGHEATRLEASGHLARDALVQQARRSGRAARVEPADGTHHRGRRHATQEAVALDEPGLRTGPRGPERGRHARGAASDDQHVASARAGAHGLTPPARPRCRHRRRRGRARPRRR